MLRISSATSSLTPGTVENSCCTPSMRTLVAATPGRELSSTRRRELPRVCPKPRSNGLTTNFAVAIVFARLHTFDFRLFDLIDHSAFPPLLTRRSLRCVRGAKPPPASGTRRRVLRNKELCLYQREYSSTMRFSWIVRSISSRLGSAVMVALRFSASMHHPLGDDPAGAFTQRLEVLGFRGLGSQR